MESNNGISDVTMDENPAPPNHKPTLTFGEKLVGIGFNPSSDDKVSKAKRLCADLADLLYEEVHSNNETTQLQKQLYAHAVGEILNAQMNVVKVLTLKY